VNNFPILSSPQTRCLEFCTFSSFRFVSNFGF
jgi:hypothetical protein